MAFEKMLQAPSESEYSEVKLDDLEETIGYLRNACGGEKGADEMLSGIANCMKNAHEQLSKAHSPGAKDKVMHQYNRCIEKAIDDHIPSSALKERVTVIGGVTTTFALIGSALPGPGTAAGAVIGAIVGAIAGAVVGTTISHKLPVQKGHGNVVREMLHDGKLDVIIGSRKTGGGMERIGKYVKARREED